MADATTAPGHPRKASPPWGLLGMAILVAGVESFVARHGDFVNLAAAEHRFAAGASREARRHEVLAFGDSQVKDGVVPRVVEARSGLRTLNLAIPGSPAPSSYILLRRVLESGARPSAILVDYHAWVLQVDPPSRVPMYAELCDLRECLELAWTARDARFLGSLATTKLLPSFRVRAEIRADVLAAFRGESADARRRTVAQARRNWAANGGAQVMPRNPDVATIAEFWDESASYPEHWSCPPTNRVYVRGFLRLAAEHRIPVFFLIPPRHPRVQANRERLGLDARYTRFVRAATAGFANVTVVDGRYSGYAPTVFIDSSHFDRQGACDFSADVASVVADRLDSKAPGRPSWVNLPPHRDRPATVPVEDLTQSELALKSTATGVRR